MDSKKQRTGTDIVEDLASIVFETDEFPTKAEAMQILEEEQVDSKLVARWTLEKLKGIRARQKLVDAREKRLRWEEAFGRCRDKVLGMGSTLRDSVLSKLRILGDSDPEAAQVYCRKFESMSDDDLPELDAELSLLEQLHDEANGDD